MIFCCVDDLEKEFYLFCRILLWSCCRTLNKDPDPVASFSLAYLFILFPFQGICSLRDTEQDVSLNFQCWKVDFISLCTSIMCCLISGIKFNQHLTAHCVS
ncbi:hypothetical protein MKW92_027078 [Papaver armeniacum]|nr:hypothetical protein MKW92_027078 [Papaver armeniacum]